MNRSFMGKPQGGNWRKGQAAFRGFGEDVLGSCQEALERRLQRALGRERDGLLGRGVWPSGNWQLRDWQLANAED